ncbi:hypothetical protein HT031_001296 [Scenedesmus sp. PABB004]|nr:hypothetical protein HT031_001296 [Scenedesmus sp. PABB004]
MPPGVGQLPGPHDPHNLHSIRLAEATRIRLVLPGLALGRGDEEGAAGGGGKRGGGGSAAAAARPGEPPASASRAKARRKLQKLQGIAAQAESAHAAIIVDAGLLAGDDDGGEPAVSHGAERAPAAAAPAAPGGAAAAGAPGSGVSGSDGRAARQGAAAAAAAPAGPAGVADAAAAQLRRSARRLGEAVPRPGCPSLPSPGALGVADDGAELAGGVPPVERPAAPDKPRVPIWDRLPAGPEERRAAPAQRVFSQVALKTFSPTLGSLCCGLGSSVAAGDAASTAPTAAASRAAPGRTRSAIRSPAAHRQPPAPPRAPPGQLSPSRLLEKLVLGG